VVSIETLLEDARFSANCAEGSGEFSSSFVFAEPTLASPAASKTWQLSDPREVSLCGTHSTIFPDPRRAPQSRFPRTQICWASSEAVM
jgi:hypothetical protein